jgi:hypothetical protein
MFIDRFSEEPYLKKLTTTRTEKGDVVDTADYNSRAEFISVFYTSATFQRRRKVGFPSA